MIDAGISSLSSLRLLVFQALKGYETKVLFQFLGDRSSIVRTAAARELQMRGGNDVFQKGVELLGSKSAVKREIGAFLLGQLGTPNMPFRDETIPLLESRLREDPFPAVREAAAAALGHLHAVQSVDALISAADDETAQVRAAIAFSLSRFQDSPEALSCLKQLQHDQDPMVREWAAIQHDEQLRP